MKLKRIIGYLLLALVFVVIFISYVYACGLAAASVTLIISLIFVAIILLAAWLVTS